MVVGNGCEYWPEEALAVDAHDGATTGVAEAVLALLVCHAHCTVVGRVVEAVGELGIETALGERAGDHRRGDVGALLVHTLAQGGVERSECAVAGPVMGGG